MELDELEIDEPGAGTRRHRQAVAGRLHRIVRTYLAAISLACAVAAPAFAGDLTIVSKTSTTGPTANTGTSTRT